MGRGLILAALGLLALAVAAPARADDLCERITLPPGIDLTCESLNDGTDAVRVRPVESGGFGALSRLTLRPLERRGEDAQAWTDPAAWLRKRLVVDTSGIAQSLRDLATDPDSPFGGMFGGAVDTLAASLDSLGRLALEACGEPEAEGTGQRLDCRFGIEPLQLYLELRLIASGEDRYAATLWTMSDRRLRHLQAIANSFEPG